MIDNEIGTVSHGANHLAVERSDLLPDHLVVTFTWETGAVSVLSRQEALEFAHHLLRLALPVTGAAIHLVPGDIVEVTSGFEHIVGAQVEPAHLHPGQVYPATVTATVAEMGATTVWLTGFSGPCDGTRSGQDPIPRSRVIRVVRRAGEG